MNKPILKDSVDTPTTINRCLLLGKYPLLLGFFRHVQSMLTFFVLERNCLLNDLNGDVSTFLSCSFLIAQGLSIGHVPIVTSH